MRFNASLPVAIAATSVVISLAAPVAVASNNGVSNPHRFQHRLHRERPYQATYRSAVDGRALPYRPEYGFLSHVPSNAIRMPGYTFVPGVGILGASCDLPTSACSNQYRDVQ